MDRKEIITQVGLEKYLSWMTDEQMSILTKRIKQANHILEETKTSDEWVVDYPSQASASVEEPQFYLVKKTDEDVALHIFADETFVDGDFGLISAEEVSMLYQFTEILKEEWRNERVGDLKDYPLFIHGKVKSETDLTLLERLDVLVDADFSKKEHTYWDVVSVFTELEDESEFSEIIAMKLGLIAEKIEKYAEGLIKQVEERLKWQVFDSFDEKYTTGDGLFIHEMYSIVHTLNLIHVVYKEDLEEQEKNKIK